MRASRLQIHRNRIERYNALCFMQNTECLDFNKKNQQQKLGLTYAARKLKTLRNNLRMFINEKIYKKTLKISPQNRLFSLNIIFILCAS